TSRSKPFIKTAFLTGLCCGIITIILYSPVIVTSGGWSNFLKVLYFGYDDTASISRLRYFIDSVYALQFFEWSIAIIVLFIFLLVLMNATFAHSSLILRGEAYNDATADLFADQMLKDADKIDTCYTFDLFYLANIQLRYALVKRPLTVYQNQPGSPSSAAFKY